MGLLDLLKLAVLGTQEPPAQPAVAALTIISSDPVKSSSGSRSAKARD